MKISYAKTVYGQKEINAVVECLKEGTQMGKRTTQFETEISKLFSKSMDYLLIPARQLCILEWRSRLLERVQKSLHLL